MFETSFPPASPNAPLTVEAARKITAPLYEALNEPAKKDINALLAAAAHPDYQSYHTNEEFLTRDQLAEIFKGMGVVTPDLHWSVKDIMVIADTIYRSRRGDRNAYRRLLGRQVDGQEFQDNGHRRLLGSRREACACVSRRELDDSSAADRKVGRGT
jgi:hypothetical protein